MRNVVLDLTADPETRRRLAAQLPGEAEIVGLDELKRLGRWSAVRRLRRSTFDTSVALVSELRTPGKWLQLVLLTLATRARRRLVMDGSGATASVSWASFFGRELPFAIRRGWVSFRTRARVRRALAQLPASTAAAAVLPKRIVFLRSDLGPPLVAGGSLAHIRGVLGGFRAAGCAVDLVSPARVAGVQRDGVETVLVPPDPGRALSVELPHLAYNETLLPRFLDLIADRRPDLIYARHALGCFAAAAAARRSGLPLVIEYNGPEVWIARHWGSARKHLGLFEEIERRTLRAADLVVAVSDTLRDPLRAAGVDEARILVNPNGVDPERFDPQRNHAAGRAARAGLGLADDMIVAGFVGTFGPWHGAEALAAAIGEIPDAALGRMRFLFIGDGGGRGPAVEILRAARREDAAIFAGTVAFDEIPALLAACDLCVSPHVPNPDGSRFFGSPTKLFEYLAAGRAVVASELGQIGELIEHGRTGWLVPPGDVGALARALVRLADDADLRSRLGEAGRVRAVEEHSWDAHVRRILDRLAGAP